MGIGSAVTAVKAFIGAHKVAIGVTSGATAVAGVTYWKREALINRIIAARHKGLLTRVEVSETLLERSTAELKASEETLVETATELGNLQQEVEPLRMAQANFDKQLKDSELRIKELETQLHDAPTAGAWSSFQAELLAEKAKVTALESRISELETLVAAKNAELEKVTARAQAQQEEIQRLMSGQDGDGRIEELDKVASEPTKESNAAFPNKTERRRRREQERNQTKPNGPGTRTQA